MVNKSESPVLDAAQPGVTDHAGPRKLVRPRLAENAVGKRPANPRKAGLLLAHQEFVPANSSYSGSHAEIFYYQKQMQSQTVMVFVLDDGERIQGVIEWYDLHVVKVRHATRTMIYKSSIKYLFKADDIASAGVYVNGT